MLTPTQCQEYQAQGYIVLKNQIPHQILDDIRSELQGFNRIASGMTNSDERIELESNHSSETPRIRRIKLPHIQMPSCAGLMRHECILEPVRDLIGPNLRLHTSKLNMKHAGCGAAVEWHQDWAFYPHTNDDILAVGVMIDDMTIHNGPLLVVPGSHRGKIYQHHADGQFVGAISAEEIEITAAKPVIAPCTPGAWLRSESIQR